MFQTLKKYHLEQAKFWQDLAAFEYKCSIREDIGRYKEYWQRMSANSYRCAMLHLKKAGVITDVD